MNRGRSEDSVIYTSAWCVCVYALSAVEEVLCEIKSYNITQCTTLAHR